jgi:hypothetical protein
MHTDLKLKPLVFETTIEKSTIPKIIYKYRNWDCKNHKKILLENSIWFSSPMGLIENKSDEMVCSFDFSWFQNFNNLKRYLKSTIESRGDFSSFKKKLIIEDKMVEILKNWPQTHIEIIEKYKDCLNQKMGVFCSCLEPDNPILWDQFSKNHTGFCVGLDLTKIQASENTSSCCCKVNYIDTQEKIIIKPNPFDSDLDSILRISEAIYTLPNKFKEEQEFRLTKSYCSGLVEMPNNCICEVILGAKMSSEHKMEIKALVKSKYPSVLVKQAILAPGFDEDFVFIQ